MSAYDSSSIHRYLDAAFAEVPPSPEAQDLKEEIRGNLSARIAELEAAGATGAAAIRAAIKELGDIHEILAPLGAPDRELPTRREGAAATFLRNRVRPKPGFVVRAAVLGLIATSGIAVVALAALGHLSFGAASFGAASFGAVAQAALACLAIAIPVGLLVADSLRQETSQNYPLPRARASWYGASSALGVLGLALGGVYWADHSAPWPLFLGVACVVVAAVVSTYLGATQTNRKKPWVRAIGEQWKSAFTGGASVEDLIKDPAAEARFGIYSGALWIVALGAFIALSIAIGFTWSWLALFGALVLQMIMLARMLFPPGQRRP